MKQEYYIKGQTLTELHDLYKKIIVLGAKETRSQKWINNNILNQCNEKWIFVKDLIKLLEATIKDVEEAQGNEFDRGYATALFVFKDWIEDNILSSDSELDSSTHNED
jgi:hypothetical protein